MSTPLATTPTPPTVRVYSPLPAAADATTIVTGTRLYVSRVVWAAGVLLYLGLFVAGIPAAYTRALILSPETTAALARVGLSASFPAMFWLTLDSLTILSFTALAVFIVLRRPNDWLVMLTSLTLVGTATLYTDAPAETPGLLYLAAFLFAFAEICQVSFVYLFPNGKFLPRWTGFLLIPLFVWRPLIWGLVYLPNFYLATNTGENYGTLRQGTVDTLLMVGLFAIGIGSQVYRYRHAATPVQKQQTKWLVLGIIGSIAVAASYVVVVNALGLLSPTGLNALIERMVGRTLRQLALFLLPLSLTFSILRYRLWDIDVILRRTLIYVPLTGILAGLFAALVTLFQDIFVAVTGQQSVIATVLSTIAVVAAIDPMHQLLKKFVERRFKDPADAQTQLYAFGERVQTRLSVVDAGQIILRFTAEAVNAFHATGGAAFLDHGGTLVRAGTRGVWNDEACVTVDVRSAAKRYGAIALGPRPFDRPYTTADRALLEKIAGIVGEAIEQDRELEQHAMFESCVIFPKGKHTGVPLRVSLNVSDAE